MSEVIDEVQPDCYCDTCEEGHRNGCLHAEGIHYNAWGEGISSPDYCPFNHDDDDALPF